MERVQFTINNYALGAKLKTSPTGKIAERRRIDKSHTSIVYEGLTKGELQLCEKLFAKKGTKLNAEKRADD